MVLKRVNVEPSTKISSGTVGASVSWSSSGACRQFAVGANSRSSAEDGESLSPAASRFIGKAHRPTGPRLLTPTDIAEAMGKALGRKIRYQNIPLKMFSKAAASLGISEFVITMYWFLQDYQQNAFGIGAPTETVQELTGNPPEDFETIARRYVAISPFAWACGRDARNCGVGGGVAGPDSGHQQNGDALRRSAPLQLRPCRRLACLANHPCLTIVGDGSFKQGPQ